VEETEEVSAEVELLELLTQARAAHVGVHRSLRSIPGVTKAHERALALCFEDIGVFEREVVKLVKV
jgi:hypothetical protein